MDIKFLVFLSLAGAVWGYSFRALELSFQAGCSIASPALLQKCNSAASESSACQKNFIKGLCLRNFLSFWVAIRSSHSLNG
jgi:hypothetical protein